MFNWLFKQHTHDFTKWEIIKRLSNNSGEYAIIQECHCITCGYSKINREEV